MSAPPVRQRCWNHANREAVCRCPECGRPFCRECVTEHEARLLCAVCLQALALQTEMRTPFRRRLGLVVLFVASIAFTWILFLTSGAVLTELTAPTERTPWQGP